MTKRDRSLKTDLARASRKTIPVNLIYPPSYTPGDGNRPAIMLEEVVSPADALEALDKIEAMMKEDALKEAAATDK